MTPLESRNPMQAEDESQHHPNITYSRCNCPVSSPYNEAMEAQDTSIKDQHPETILQGTPGGGSRDRHRIEGVEKTINGRDASLRHEKYPLTVV